MTIDHCFFPSVQFVKIHQIKSQINHKSENKYREIKCQNYKTPTNTGDLRGSFNEEHRHLGVTP